MPDPYASCPCGSGKKFKWCCQPIYAGIERAFDQEASGQHEAALRTIDEVVRHHGDNPEAWGQKARLLYANDRVEEAENTLQKAFDLNPNYPYGLFLRAMFRHHEGEVPGALLLARRAADAYDPAAHEYLAQVYGIIVECELKLNRPVAARAALRLVTRFQPAGEDAHTAFDALFGEQSRLPAAARREYTFRSSPRTAARLGDGAAPRLGDLVRIFEAVTQEAPDDVAAWFNLGLSRAWLGDNRAALEALERYLDLEPDEAAAAEAATLGEVLRCGHGLENDCDYHEYGFVHQIRNPQPINAMLEDWARSRRLLVLPRQKENTLLALVLEDNPAGLITAGAPTTDVARLAGYLAIVGNLFQVTGPLKETFDRLRDEVRQRLGLVSLGDLREMRAPAQFQEVVAEAVLFPRPGTPEEGLAERVLEHAQRYYEETWVHRPRQSLAGNTPVDAAGHAKLRKKLRGVIQFMQDCARGGMIANYDFDRLRRKLGLLDATTAAAPAAGAPAAGSAPADVAAMGAAELGGLQVEALPDEQLEQAYHAAQKLDAGDLAAHFAQALVARPPRPERPDRYPWYAYLTQHALRAGNTDAALDYLNEGERADGEHNEGRRRDDYELRRGQVHVKRGDPDAVQDVFRRLIERAPANPKYRGSAAEAMLSLRQGARALHFAEEGLAVARQQNDRDSEQYLLELVAAAKKQMG
jgi:tetratricopeptide (TPR) repeat protein